MMATQIRIYDDVAPYIVFDRIHRTYCLKINGTVDDAKIALYLGFSTRTYKQILKKLGAHKRNNECVFGDLETAKKLLNLLEPYIIAAKLREI